MNRRTPVIAALLLALLAPAAHACTVCFGGVDSNMVRGFTWGIWILLLLPYALAAGLITMIVRSARKKKADGR